MNTFVTLLNHNIFLELMQSQNERQVVDFWNKLLIKSILELEIFAC